MQIITFFESKPEMSSLEEFFFLSFSLKLFFFFFVALSSLSSYVLGVDVLNIKGIKKGRWLNLARCARQEGVLQLRWDEQMLHTTQLKSSGTTAILSLQQANSKKNR